MLLTKLLHSLQSPASRYSSSLQTVPRPQLISLSDKIPLGQGSHETAPSGTRGALPGSHSMQTELSVAASRDEKVLVGHGVQAVAIVFPIDELYFPAAQFVQVAAVAPLYFPAPQSWQVASLVAPVAENRNLITNNLGNTDIRDPTEGNLLRSLVVW